MAAVSRVHPPHHDLRPSFKCELRTSARCPKITALRTRTADGRWACGHCASLLPAQGLPAEPVATRPA